VVAVKRRIARSLAPAAAITAAIAAAIAAAMAIAAGSAQAGAYHVYTCRTPSGESAPADGWSGSETGPYSYLEDGCPHPSGALLAALGDNARTANTEVATWAFAAPEGETIAAATLWRAGDVAGGEALNAAYELWFGGPENDITNPTENFAQCEAGPECPGGVGSTSEPLSSEDRLAVPSSNLGSHLYMSASCIGVSGYACPTGAGDADGYAAAVYLYAADITLEQSAGPSADNVGGELASAPTVQGTSDVTFSASDPGGGVYEAVFNIDGHVVQQTVVDENGGRCRNVGQTEDGLAAFLYVKPCLASVSVDIPFNTASASNGTHHLLVSVIDAAGNAAPVLDREITVANPTVPGPPPAQGALNGTNASVKATLSASWKGTGKERLTSGFGHAQTIIGRLTGAGGQPIAGALIGLVATPAYLGAPAAAMASPRTDPEGRFSVRLPDGVSSSTLRLAYSPDLGDAQPVATRTLTLTVRAGIALSVAPRTTSVGRSIFFSGRLRGGPFPPDGKQLVLEARSPGSPWLEFKVIRTGARGRYHASYRFKFPGPVDYRFRVLSEPESDYPFAVGYSNVVGVFER
jgi:hypothetical protein